VDEAYDLSELEASILKSMEKLTHELSQLRAGGRFNPEKIEALKVTLQDSDGGNKRTERVGDLAQVIAKGRNVQVLIHDEAFVKPINTAIVTSALNLTPHGPTPDQPTTLTIQVPPPTGESRMQAAEAAKKAEEAALGRIKDARGKHQKKLRSFGVSKSVRPDDLQKAQKGMEDVVKRGNEDVKKVVEDARRVLERG
jgi:ribosome recycling factor